MEKKSANFWFRQKTYGYGVTPCAWQGWGLTLLFAVWLVGITFFLLPVEEEKLGIEFFYYLGSFVLSVVAFLIVIKPKTRGEMKWRWGQDNKD